jgi:hypothetical protein
MAEALRNSSAGCGHETPVVTHGPALPSAAMKVEVLYFDGCPNYGALLPRLRELLASAGAHPDIELVRVEDLDAAERERFLGSPTVRINGEDVEPGADERIDFGLKCRLFATPDGLRGMPADEWVVAAALAGRHTAQPTAPRPRPWRS